MSRVTRSRDRSSRGALLPQRHGLVVSRIVEHPDDLVETDAQFPEQQDLLQALQVPVLVEAVPGFGAPTRGEQPDLVVVVEGANRDPGEPGHRTDGLGHLDADARP